MNEKLELFAKEIDINTRDMDFCYMLLADQRPAITYEKWKKKWDGEFYKDPINLHDSARKKIGNKKIAEFMKELMKETNEFVFINKAYIINEALFLYNKNKNDSFNQKTALECLKFMGKELGMGIDRIDLTTQGDKLSWADALVKSNGQLKLKKQRQEEPIEAQEAEIVKTDEEIATELFG